MVKRYDERLLICNADDFGLTEKVTDAILESHLSGIMTSTTVMANMPAVEYAAKLAHRYPSLGVGIHLNLTHGRPISHPDKVRLLLDEQGMFLSNAKQRKNLMSGVEKTRQAVIELEAQMRLINKLGIVPTHFDSHHHITGVPCAFQASMIAAERMGIRRARITSIRFHLLEKARLPETAKVLWGNLISAPKSLVHLLNKKRLRNAGFQTPDDKVLPDRVIPANNDRVDQFISTLTVLRPGITEISFHPGYPDADPNDSEKTALLRVRDMEVATSPQIMQFIKENQIRLVNFKTAFE